MRMSRWKGNEKQGESQNPVVLKQKEVKLVKSLAPPLMAALVALSPIVNTPGNLQPYKGFLLIYFYSFSYLRMLN